MAKKKVTTKFEDYCKTNIVDEKLIIENTEFDFITGCKLLKLKYQSCPFKEFDSFWDDIPELTFKDIATMDNLEHRRIAMLCMGIDRLIKEVNPQMISKEVVKKKTTWVDDKGNLVTKKYNDTYELYEVQGKVFSKGIKETWRRDADNCYYIKMKDTSTDREYLIWVDVDGVYETNNPNERHYKSSSDLPITARKINPIQAIAWTIQTNVPKDNIEQIVRQGDCVMIKPIDASLKCPTRHLTENEYRQLLKAES